MKTSNKLLIAFALALIVLPLLGMAIVSRFYFKEETQQSLAGGTNDDQHFRVKTGNMVSKPIAQPFSSVEIADAKGYTINIRLVEDKDYGIKIPNDLDGRISLAVAGGQLQIAMKDRENRDRFYAEIIVYAPKINGLSISKAADVILRARLDSLNFNVKHTSDIAFESNTLIKSLIANVSNVNKIYINEQAVASMELQLDDANFDTQNCNYNSLAVSSSGNAKIWISGANNSTSKFEIKSLMIKTSDTAKVTVEDIKVVNCSGTFSDQTAVAMPAENINQMFKK